MRTDPRIEAAAIAMHCGLSDATAPFHVWNGDTERERERYRMDAQIGLGAADNAATITDPEQLNVLSLEAHIVHGGYEWHRHGYRWQNVNGEVRDSADLVPARVTVWGGVA